MKVLAEIDQDKQRIMTLVERFYAGYNDKAKQITGYYWEAEMPGKPWSYPLSMRTCHSLREVFGENLEIGPKLWDWAKAQKQHAQARRDLAAKPDSDLPILRTTHPEFFAAMNRRPYQRSGAAFLSRGGGNLDEPGLGKTAEALAAIIEAGKWEGDHLVICPKTAIFSTWVHEIQKWTPDAAVFGMPDGRAARDKAMDRFFNSNAKTNFLVIHPHMLQIKMGKWCRKCKIWMDEKGVDIPGKHYGDNHQSGSVIQKDKNIEWPDVFDVGWDSVIADECDEYLLKLRDPRAKYQPQWANGMRRLLKVMQPDGLRIPMTGTPFRGKEYNIYGILYWMDPTIGGFWSWASHYFEVDENEFYLPGGKGEKGKKQTVSKLRSDREAEFYGMLDQYFLRRTKREVRDDIPAQNPIEMWVELDGEHRRQYTQFEKEALVSLESGVLEGMGRLSEMTRLRQLSFGCWDIKPTEKSIQLEPVIRKSPKVDLLLGMLRERGVLGDNKQDTGAKFIIVSQWASVLMGLEELFLAENVRTLSIRGNVTGQKRLAAKNSFQEDPDGPRLLLLQTVTGGKSLTLDRYCDEMFLMDETWVHDDQIQVMARINNRGEDIRPRTYYFLRTKGTVEERIALRNAYQADMQSLLLDGRRGKDFALSLIRRG